MSHGLNGLAKRIAWGETNAPPPPVLPEVLRPGMGEEVEVVLLDGLAVAVWLHWTGKRSVPHLVGQGACKACQEGQIAKQYAYISAWYLRRNKVALLELTAHALAWCPEVLQPSQERPLRGRHALVTRSAGHRSARCRIRLLDATRPEPLPAGLNVRSVLEHLWGYDPQTRAALGLDVPHQSGEEEVDRDDR